jgi:predicted nuclease of predicted toxin-antitoxin system
MKLLLDENISYRTLNLIDKIFPGSEHVTRTVSQIKSDLEIFEYAKQYDFTILTFDEDFYDLQLLKGFPPKIIWLRLGNSSNMNLISKISDTQSEILSFATNPDVGILEIY